MSHGILAYYWELIAPRALPHLIYSPLSPDLPFTVENSGILVITFMKMNSSRNLNELESRSLIPSKTEIHLNIGYKFCHMCVHIYINAYILCIHTHMIVAAQLVEKLSIA